MPRAPATKARPAPLVIDDALPFERLPTLVFERLATLLSRHGELLYQRLFGLRLSECRLLAIAYADEPLSLRRACEKLELDKGHTSRLVTGLVAAGLVERRADAQDQRSFHLFLTASGRRTAARIRRAALQRNRRWLASFTTLSEAARFVAMLDRQTQSARAMLESERRRSDRAEAAPSASHDGGAAARTLLLVDRGELEDLRGRLDRVLGDTTTGAAPTRAGQTSRKRARS